MRLMVVALLLPLAACGGGGGVDSAGSLSAGGSTAASGLNSATGTTTTPTTTTTTTTTTSTTTAPYTSSQANMFDVTSAVTFSAMTAMHSLATDKDGAQLYKGNASTAAGAGSISYNPRDGIFTMTLADDAAAINHKITFQDPAHRTTTDSGGVEYQVPTLPGFNYLSALDGKANLTFFYQRPNSAASFVSLAGFERSEKKDDGSALTEQGVIVFGAQTLLSDLPTRGTAHFDGLFLATMTEQQILDPRSSVQQWMNGTSAVDVDFAKRSLSVALSGQVGPAYVKDTRVDESLLSVRTGSTFAAQGTAAWTAAANAFTGKITSAGFTTGSTAIPVDFTSVSAGTAVAGASSIDGAFYGPDTKNIGGNFRIVGGIPNQRVDILGGFVGAKK